MTHLRWLFLLLALAWTAPAVAADVVYPPSSRIGLVPPPGMTPTSIGFIGFEDREHAAAIVVVALPHDAYEQIEKTATDQALSSQGLQIEKREAVTVGGAQGFLVVGQQQAGGLSVRKWMLVALTPTVTAMVNVQVPSSARELYPDEVVRAALQSIEFREKVPVEEQLSLFPFKLRELAGFHVTGVAPGRAVVLSDSDQLMATPAGEPRLIIALEPGAPGQPSDRDEFAREVFEAIPGLVNVRVTASEPLRIGGQIGHQIMANAVERATGKNVTLVQWIRFGSEAYMQIVGIARENDWPQAYPRFRLVRDGIDAH